MDSNSKFSLVQILTDQNFLKSNSGDLDANEMKKYVGFIEDIYKKLLDHEDFVEIKRKIIFGEKKKSKKKNITPKLRLFIENEINKAFDIDLLDKDDDEDEKSGNKEDFENEEEIKEDD
jgi:hypothetical protein